MLLCALACVCYHYKSRMNVKENSQNLNPPKFSHFTPKMLPTIASLVIIIIISAEILLEADGTTVTIKAYCKYDKNGLIPVTAQSKDHIEIFEKLGYKQVGEPKLDGISCAFTLVNDEDEKDEELVQLLNNYHSAEKAKAKSRAKFVDICDFHHRIDDGTYNRKADPELFDQWDKDEKDSENVMNEKTADFLRADRALNNYIQTAAQKKKAQNTNTEKVDGSKGSESSKTGEEKKDKM